MSLLVPLKTWSHIALFFCDWLTPIPGKHCCYDSGGQVLEGSSLCFYSNAPFRLEDSSRCCELHPQLFHVVMYGAFSFPLWIRLSSTAVLDLVFFFSLCFVFPSHCYIFSCAFLLALITCTCSLYSDEITCLQYIILSFFSSLLIRSLYDSAPSCVGLSFSHLWDLLSVFWKSAAAVCVSTFCLLILFI